MNLLMYVLSGRIYSLLLGQFLELEFLSCVQMHLVLAETAKLVYKVVMLFYIINV